MAVGRGYAIICSEAVANDPAWHAVVLALAQKHARNGIPAPHGVIDSAPHPQMAAHLGDMLDALGARYAAFVLKPEEIGREAVTAIHRATRMLDDDPWGDCLWGIVTGATPEHALRLAKAAEPLCIKRLLGTTNVGAAPFEQSCCITDWENSPVLRRSGYGEVQVEHPAPDSGREGIFAEELAAQKPQLLVTASHATPFNLEMPFGKGLIFPARGRFHLLSAEQMPRFSATLAATMRGDSTALGALADELTAPAIEPDGEPRVWLAAGNCLIGTAHHRADSMVVTALSAYNCHQVVGYTVPTWYGKAGWGTLSLFMDNTEGCSLAEAWFLNNQFLLEETQRLSPELLRAEFNEAEMGEDFLRRMMPLLRELALPQERLSDALGLVHDRDVLAFYGDPTLRAVVDNSHHPRPLRVEWQGEKSFTLTANRDHKGRAALWFPTAATGRNATGCNVPGAVLTDDFILFPTLELKEGEVLRVEIW